MTLICTWRIIVEGHRKVPAVTIKRIAPKYAYIAASGIVVVWWYGVRYEIFVYEHDLVHYGPLGHLAYWLGQPFSFGFLHLSESEYLFTVALLIWLLWFVVLRLAITGWNLLAGVSA